MNKRFVSIILLVILVLGNTIAFAEPGDFIHTGLKKIYKHKSEKDSNELIQDVLDGVDVNKFYREVENGKYVNITEEERKQMAEIEKLLRDAGITNPNEIRNYLIENKEKLDRKFADIIGEIATSFEDIDDENKGKIQDYKGASDVFILTTDNYSTPEPGFKEGSTKIARLRLPNEANKWKIQISDKQVPPMSKDTILKDSIDYVSGRDISIEVGQYLVLYAVDNGNKIKAYANIKITENMINTPKELAPKIEIGNVSEGEKYVGAVVINKLGELPKGASKWQILISPIPVERVYKAKMSGAMDYRPGEDIIMAAENELHPISNSFKKYLVLVAVDNEGIVQAYNTFEINKNNISKAPTLLKENTHYKGPVPGNNDGTTKFTELHFGLNPDENMKDAETWKAWTSKNPIAVPKLNAGAPGTVLYALDEIEASIGNYLLLAAMDENNKIKGYRIFHLTETMVKGQTAPQLEEEKHYYKPEKGLTEGTTRINKLNLGGIEGATKWMYKIGESLDDPIFNRVVSGSSDYIAGQNVRTNVDDDFLLLATDKEGKVKAFAKIKLDENMIKDPPPALLREGMNYIGPVKGENPGTTKFEALAGSDSIGHNPKWMYMISDEEPEIPELNSTVQGATEFGPKDSIGENLLPGKYLILLATENGKIKGYAIFRLNNANIKMPPAALLKEGDHYNKAEKGSGAGTTRITGLKSIGIDGVEQWRIKTNPEPFLKDGESLELNSIVPQANIYNDGNNIRVNTNDWILLLATDYSGRVKAYSQIKLNEENIRKPNATLLIPGTNYTEPEAGSEENTTRFRFLDTSTNVIDATKWMYKVGKTTFGPIELDSIVEDALPALGGYKAGENIGGVSNGDYLVLLATDKDGKVKGYREFILLERNIRGGPARMLNEDNYELEKGNRPGTTKFNKLIPLGMEGSIRWKYKLMDSELPEKEKPYLNSIIEDANFVALGQDIVVNEIGGDYGHLLLLATDYSNRTKGYAEIKIDPTIVKEHAPTWDVELEKGSMVDSVRITGKLPSGANSVKYIRNYREIPIPAFDEILDGGSPYSLGEDISQVRIGEYIGIYAVDDNNKIKAFKSLEITAKDIKQGNATMEDATFLEGSINNGGSKIKIKLEDAKWAGDLKTNAEKRQELYNGFKADSQAQEWTKLVASLIKDGSGAIDISKNRDILTISLPHTADYDISRDQKITLTVPAAAIDEAINPIKANGTITIKPTVKATVSGDVVDSIVRENDIRAGGKTIVVELKDGDWAGDIDSDVNVNKLISGFSSSGPNWDKIAREIEIENVVRNSSKKLTITLPPIDDSVGINFDVNKEIISLTIPEALIQGAKTKVVATPRFTLYPNVLQVAGEATDKDTVKLEAPDGRTPRAGMDIWEIQVETGTLKDNITDKDIIVSGLPKGLRANVIGVDGNIISIKVSGTAASKIEDMEVQVKVKGQAVEEPNSQDSEYIRLRLKVSESLESELKSVNYDLRDENHSLKIYLINADDKMEYSDDSTNGINGNWTSASSGTDGILISDAKPTRIWVREKAQPKVFRLVGDLKSKPAPVDVGIASYVYGNHGLEVILSGETTAMEYTTNGGKDWTIINNVGQPIKLDADSDLKIRYKAVPGKSGELPSLSTKKLNGIYLQNVELNVVQGIIENTTTNMEYSTDGEKYTQARNGNTPVNFVRNTEIWIRERAKGNEINKRKLGKVGQMEFNEDGLAYVKYDISKEKISLEGSPGFSLGDLQYKLASDPWQDVDDGKNIGFKAGSLQFRKKGDTSNLPSEAREKAIIAPATPAPNLNYDDVNNTIEKISSGEGGDYEYSIDGGINWNGVDASNIPTFEAGQEVQIRKKATATKLASEIQTIRFTPNLKFSNVYLNAGKSMIVNTTAEMEYSLNSTNGLDGQWYRASSPNTPIPLKKGMIVWIREAGKPKNYRKLSSGPMVEKEFENEDLSPIGFSIVDQTISIDTSGLDISQMQKIVDDLQYRIDYSNWINIPYTKLVAGKNILAYNVEFKPGKIEFRLRGDKDKLPSKPLTKAVIKANVSPPNVEIDYVENRVLSINSVGKNDSNWESEWKLFEYSVDNGPWINGRYLKDEDLSGERILRIREKAKDNKLPSQEAVINFKEKLPLEHVILSTHVQPLELNGTTTQMEYRINNAKWKQCDNGNTKLTRMDGSDLNDLADVSIIEIRDSKQPENKRTVYTK